MAGDPPGCFAGMHRELVSRATPREVGWRSGRFRLMHDGAHPGEIGSKRERELPI